MIDNMPQPLTKALPGLNVADTTTNVAATPGTTTTALTIECSGLRLRYRRWRGEALAGIELNLPREAICGRF
jgi:hypothetical protein